MATIIESDTSPSRPVLVTTEDSGAGWAVAALIIVVVLVAGAFWYMRYYRAPASNAGATILVNLPSSGYAPATTPAAPDSNAPAQ